MQVGVPAGHRVWLDLGTVSGQARNGLDMGPGPGENGHDLTLQLRTVSGDIDIHSV